MTRFVAIGLPSYDTWRMRLALTLLVFAAATFAVADAHAFELEEALKAQHAQYQEPAEYHATQSGGMSLSEAIQSVKNRTDGKVISAETRMQGGREVHHIKVLQKDGKVKTYKVNGRSR